MIKRYSKNTSNISDTVNFILKTAKKRRSNAVATAKAINSNIGLGNKLIAIT